MQLDTTARSLVNSLETAPGKHSINPVKIPVTMRQSKIESFRPDFVRSSSQAPTFCAVNADSAERKAMCDRQPRCCLAQNNMAISPVIRWSTILGVLHRHGWSRSIFVHLCILIPKNSGNQFFNMDQGAAVNHIVKGNQPPASVIKALQPTVGEARLQNSRVGRNNYGVIFLNKLQN